MLGQLAASKAAKIAALCICPVGAAVVTTKVPAVRSAVHKMTAPPKKVPARRIAPRTPPAAQTALASPCPTPIPVLLQNPGPLDVTMPVIQSTSPFNQALLPGVTASPSPRFTEVAPGTFPPTVTPPGTLPILPEPSSWVQFGLGFALIGSAIRSPRVRARIIRQKESLPA